MAREAKEIDLCQIGDALEVDFVKASWKSGNPDMKCLIASGMAGIMDGIYEDLNEKCRERLKSITIDDINNKIFKED